MPLQRFRRERFDAVWRELDLTPRAGLFDELAAHYAEPHRTYHTAAHVDECLEQLDATRALCEHPLLVELALWFHDAIYDTHSEDNELLSANWAAQELLDAHALPAVAESVRDLVLVTRHDTVATTPDAQLLTDIDLSILGAPRARFAEYEEQVRSEYSWVPEELFTRERAMILTHLLARPSIYVTPFFRDRFEQSARENLAWSIAQLE